MIPVVNSIVQFSDGRCKHSKLGPVHEHKKFPLEEFLVTEAMEFRRSRP